ncbi:MAG: molybdopterin molybdotransferase MoeA [Pseudomonadota bacterium]
MTAKMISVDEAWSIVGAHAVNTAVETVPLREAVGRTLALPIIAQLTQPPLTVSAMDGYGVMYSDVEAGGADLVVIGEAPAGRLFPGRVTTGQAVRIFTGGALPDGADHVVIQEHVHRSGDLIHIPEAEAGPKHVRKAGIDFHQGDELLAAGVTLGPAQIAIAAAGNHAQVSVHRRPRIALIANGDELKPAGSTLGPGEIIASNGYGLAALIESWGGEAMDLGIAPDHPAAIDEMIDSAKGADIILPVGGASVGDHDHMRSVFSARGLDMVFEKVAVKPGKPTWFGKLDAALVLGLPGNPASAWVCAHLFLKPLMARRNTLVETSQLSGPVPSNGPRESFLRARRSRDGVTAVANQDSSLLTPFLTSNVLIRRRPHAPAAALGDMVEVVALG